jgi:hypothetical protein
VPSRQPRDNTASRRLLLCSVAACSVLAGCMSVYQPMTGLQRPIAINIDYANFQGLELSLQCLPGPIVTDTEAEDLCRKLARLYENQGATVETRTTPGRVGDPEDEITDVKAPGDAATPTMALSVELSSRLIHKEETNILWWSITTDYTFAQDIVIRDATGFLLLRETLTGRFRKSLGFRALAAEQFSRDYYAQLSQLALNAKMRREVLSESRPKPVAN